MWCDFSPSPLMMAVASRLSNNGWSPDDFRDIYPTKCLTFNYFIEASDLLSDKAISTQRSSSFEKFDRTAYKAYYGREPPRTSAKERRVIPQYLFHDNISVRDVITRVENDTVPYEAKWLTVVLKGKEPKIEKARGYCKLTYDMRLFQVSTEKNIADALFPYVTHQSMTMTEQTPVNTICRITAPFSQGDRRYIFLSLDFKRWCLKMSQRVLAPLFSELDRLFGFTHFSYLTYAF